MRHSILLVPPVLGAALFWQASGCTLTSEPFKPQEVRDSALMPSGSEDDPAEPGASEDNGSEQPMCSSSELGGCPLPVDGVGSECDSDVDCESQVCASGRCAAASCSDGRENGSETGVDCGGSCEPCSDCDGAECNPPDPTCDDRIRNQDEGDVDCGGSCAARCEAGERCGIDGDCASGLFCPEATSQCTTVSCADGVRNGAELQVDCGGGTCPGCAIGAPCNTASDCAEGVCTDDECAAPTCNDGVRNGSESSVDCGGTCTACNDGEVCSQDADCRSEVCGVGGCGAGAPRCCQPPACNDGVQNGNESGLDCGTAACGLCPNGRPCTADAACNSGFCQSGVCRVHPCADGALNGNESDNDCGGSDPQCRRCGRGADCRINTDCASNTCDDGICVDCDDGILNGNETGVDCGGTCGLCAGQACSDDDDCATSACEDGTCCGGQLEDCTRCARRLATGIDCSSNGQAATNDCNAFLQCLADNLDDCETSTASECSDDPDDVCFYEQFGGETGPGVTLAEEVLEDAGCTL